MTKEQYLKRKEKLDNKIRRKNDKYIKKTIKLVVKKASKRMKNPQYFEGHFSGYSYSAALTEIYKQLEEKFPFFEIRVEHANYNLISVEWQLKEE